MSEIVFLILALGLLLAFVWGRHIGWKMRGAEEERLRRLPKYLWQMVPDHATCRCQMPMEGGDE